jgi:ammonia channel protein AmtB
MAFVIGFFGAATMPFVSSFVEKMKIDDAVGAVAVHMYLGFWGVLVVGIAAQGYPALAGADVIETSFTGQLVGGLVMAALGFVPGYAISWLLAAIGQLRVPAEAEIMGLDKAKVPASAYPEALHPTVTPAE